MTGVGPPLGIPRRPRYRSLDFWRGLACLIVVISHSATYVEDVASEETSWPGIVVAILHGGRVGVPMFFVISGYCIAATSDSTRRKPRAMCEYFRRRFRRIFPPYWIALLITALAVVLVTAVGGSHLFSDAVWPIPQPQNLTAAEWLGNVTLTENWRWAVFGGARNQLLGPAWTLCYEEQFYALCGLLLFLAPRRFFSGIGAVSIFTIGAMMARLTIPGLFFDGQWLLFASGVVVYYYVNYASTWCRYGIVMMFCLSALGCAALRPLDSWQSELFVLGPTFALALIALHSADSYLGKVKVLRPIFLCGTMCYSLYLVHWPVVKLVSHCFYLAGVDSLWGTVLLTIPVATGLSLLAAWLFFLAVERRFLNSPQAVRNPANCGGTPPASAVVCAAGSPEPVVSSVEPVPLVSIVIPCYKGAAFLAEAIESCLRQSYPHLEIIVVDDASPDDCAAIAERYAARDPRVRVVRRPANGGVSRAFNTGFESASGSYHTRLAQDDVFRLDAVEVMLRHLQANPEAGLAYCDYQILNPAGAVTSCVHVAPPAEALRWRNDIGICVMWRRTVWEKLGGFDCHYDTAEDFEYWVRVSQRFPIIKCGREAPLFFRHHPQMGSVRQLSRQLEATARVLRRAATPKKSRYQRISDRQRGLAYVAFATAVQRAEMGEPLPALRKVLLSFLLWPIPYRRSEMSSALVRPKLLGRCLLDLVGCWRFACALKRQGAMLLGGLKG
jgi:peptidoglycan/LPS O-acetylase OafA/YrhL